MEGICGAHCEDCPSYKKTCEGCRETNGCPFGKKCWIANYIEIDGKESFEQFKNTIIEEFNTLKVEGLPEIKELYILNGSFINQEVPLPNGEKVKLLKEDESYLGNQVECIFNEEGNKKYFGLAANMNFLLVSEYSEDGENPEIIIYKKR